MSFNSYRGDKFFKRNAVTSFNAAEVAALRLTKAVMEECGETVKFFDNGYATAMQVIDADGKFSDLTVAYAQREEFNRKTGRLVCLQKYQRGERIRVPASFDVQEFVCMA